MDAMKKFAFPNVFNGAVFYAKYKEAMFLQNQQNIVNILSGSRLLHERMESMTPGQALLIEGMFLNQETQSLFGSIELNSSTSLIIKKSSLTDDSDVDVEDFTVRRLLGLTATYLFENRDKFPDLYESLKTEVLHHIGNNRSIPNPNIIKTFVYSEIKEPQKFDNLTFYKKYNGAEFLQDERNINKILGKQHKLSQCLDALAPGESLQIEGMFIEPNTPLVVHKSYRLDESDVAGSDFTLRRLSGLTACYVWNNRKKFPDLCASEPDALGIDWKRHPRLYLSAVSGAELFVFCFGSFSFISALIKYHFKQISEEQLMQISMIRVDDENTLVESYKKKKKSFNSYVPTEFKWEKLFNTLPDHIKCYFTE